MVLEGLLKGALLEGLSGVTPRALLKGERRRWQARGHDAPNHASL